MEPKVSVLVPVYNVEKYLHECIDSILVQTLADIEVICIDDGSTDRSGSILDEYAAKDSRIRVFHIANGGVGHAMNLAMDNAVGEYIGIVESDDYISNRMYERLYETAKETGCDIVKANYDSFRDIEGTRRFITHNLLWTDKSNYNKLLNPVNVPNIFLYNMYNWAGIIKRDFLLKYGIRHNETPGAAYQDHGVFLQAYTLADRIYYLRDSLYRYRKDNPNSSIHNPNLVFRMCDEFVFAENALKRFPERLDMVRYQFYGRWYVSCAWSLMKAAPQFRGDIADRLRGDLSERIIEEEIDRLYIEDNKKEELHILWRDPNEYVDYIEQSVIDRSSYVDQLVKMAGSWNSVCIFGAGENGHKTQVALMANNIYASCFIDNSMDNQGKTWNDAIVYSAETAVSKFPDALYLIAINGAFDNVRQQLVHMGIKEDQIYESDCSRFPDL